MKPEPKIVMQVTLNAEECPDLHRELNGMSSARWRVKRLVRLASLGLLLEQGRLAARQPLAGVPLVPCTPASMALKPLATPQAPSTPVLPDPNEQTINEQLTWSDSD